MRLNILFLSVLTFAFPYMQEQYVKQRIAIPLSQDEGNSGPFNSEVFNSTEQFVDVRPGTAHEFIAPGPSDKRGPCPGLNAAANHGFLPHNGIATITQTTEGLSAAYGLGTDLASALAAISVVLTGDPISFTWSIGGWYNATPFGGQVASAPGISNSHNVYESDGSLGREDGFLSKDVVSLEKARAEALYIAAENYTLDVLRAHNKLTRDYGIANNPFYFKGPFTGVVPMIAHAFVINLMSNHSEDNKNGFLTRDVLKSFFSVTGTDSEFIYTPGYEQIPQNWYRRPGSNPYSAAASIEDTAILMAKYPEMVQIGGNLGVVNSFEAVDPAIVSGGVFTAATILEGANLPCFAFQTIKLELASTRTDLTATGMELAQDLLKEFLEPIFEVLGCPTLVEFNQSAFEKFPGFAYRTPYVS